MWSDTYSKPNAGERCGRRPGRWRPSPSAPTRPAELRCIQRTRRPQYIAKRRTRYMYRPADHTDVSRVVSVGSAGRDNVHVSRLSLDLHFAMYWGAFSGYMLDISRIHHTIPRAFCPKSESKLSPTPPPAFLAHESQYSVSVCTFLE